MLELKNITKTYEVANTKQKSPKQNKYKISSK